MIKIIWLIATVYFMSRLFRRVFVSMKEINTEVKASDVIVDVDTCLLYTSPSPRDGLLSRMPSSA